MTTSEHVKWYGSARPVYERLGLTVQTLISELLATNNINVVSVPARAKTVASFADKIARKPSADPRSAVTDLCGVRIITYLEPDVRRVTEIVRATFEVDEQNSVDKSKPSALDVVGYRSVHLICSLGSARLALPEYQAFRDCTFEIQVRTVLQHAWAEIEHDRGYKFGGELPRDLRRRLSLAAGNLESVDREFASIAADVDRYAEQLRRSAEEKTVTGPLSTVGLRVLLKLRTMEWKQMVWTPSVNLAGHTELLEELRRYGVNSLEEFDRLMTAEFIQARDRHPDPSGTNDIGIARDAMMYADIKRYFRTAYSGTWEGLDYATVKFLEEKYGDALLDQVINEHDLHLIPPY